MAPATKNLKIWRGNTERMTFRLKDSAGTPIDLTGSTAMLTIIHEGGKLTLTAIDGGVAVTDPTSGYINFDLSVANTRSIHPSPVTGARYELELQTADEQRTLLAGKVIVEGGDNAD